MVSLAVHEGMPRGDRRLVAGVGVSLAVHLLLLCAGRHAGPPVFALAKAIKKAKRRDCKDGVPGGLLAPLLLLMDKKDHGCKW